MQKNRMCSVFEKVSCVVCVCVNVLKVLCPYIGEDSFPMLQCRRSIEPLESHFFLFFLFVSLQSPTSTFRTMPFLLPPHTP